MRASESVHCFFHSLIADKLGRAPVAEALSYRSLVQEARQAA
jgi:hypothetical protein